MTNARFLRIIAHTERVNEMFRVAALVENSSAAPACESRHGLSLYLETGKHKVLFDVGPNRLFLENAAKLGVDIAAVDTVILSHGHVDHAGGLEAFLSANDRARIYLRPSATEPHYIKVLGVPFNAGMDSKLIHGDRFVFTQAETVIDDELTVFSEVKGDMPLPASDTKLFMRKPGGLVRDDFAHEQSLILTVDGKRILFSGCSHAGIVNIQRRAETVAGAGMNAIIGGFHLYNPPTRRYEKPEYIRRAAEALKRTGSVYYTCHCTGRKACEQMKPILGERLREFHTGESLKSIPEV